MIALVFAILKHSLQWRGEFHLDYGPVPEFLLRNSSARRFFSVNGRRFYPALFADAFIDLIW